MTLTESLRIALEALGANKLRTSLTMLGIIIGVGTVVAIVAIGRGTQAEVIAEFSDFGTGAFLIYPAPPDPSKLHDRQEPLTETDLENLRTLLPEVKEVLTTFDAGATVKYEQRSMQANVTGTQWQAPEVMPQKLAAGRWFSREEDLAGARVMVIGPDVATRLMPGTANPIGKHLYIAGYPFEVIGVLAGGNGALSRIAGQKDESFHIPIRWLRRITGHTRIDMVWVAVKAGADSEQVMKDAVALVERNHRGAKYAGLSVAQITESISKVTTILTGVFAAVAGFSLVVGGVGIMNIMLVSVTERTREIGVRKAIGATFRDILVQFLIEAVILSLIGGAVGLALASLPVWLIGRWLKLELLIDWTTVALAVGFSVGVGVLFGVYPAAKAARLNPIDALRYE